MSKYGALFIPDHLPLSELARQDLSKEFQNTDIHK